MILHIEYPNTERQFFKVTEFEDLNPIFDMFPRTYDIASSCETLQEALEEIAEYLSGHHMSSWVEANDISKSLRNKAVGLGLSLAAALNPSISDHARPQVKPTHNPTPIAETQNKDGFGTHPMDRFLWNVQQIESSGGKNTKHPRIKYGISKGQRAIGKWGLLKPTINEIVNRMRLSGTLTPEYAKLEPMSRDALEQHFQKNPQIELGLARKLAEQVHTRQKGDSSRAAYAWLHGHNLHPQDIHSEKILNSDYVSKYKNVDKLNPFTPKRTIAMKKTQPSIDSSDFKERVKAWYKRRQNEVMDEPMRSSNFQPDPGRIRDSDLDDIKPDSMKTPSEKLSDNIKQANKKS